jgi:short-subunit dehydrogenase
VNKEQHKNETVVIFGATSEVAQSLARVHADNKDSLIIIARNKPHLDSVAADLISRGASQVNCLYTDFDNMTEHENLLKKIEQIDNDIAKYYFFYGILPDQQACEASWDLTMNVLTTNFLSIVSLLTYIANKIEKETDRGLIVVSSVAGDRGRKSNYIYGTSKGALTIFLQGLRNRLYSSNCFVTTVKPGFIDTVMTRDFKKGILWASPENVAKDIFKGASKGKNEVYTPGFWKIIMFIIKSIPEPIFKRLNL